MKRILGILGIAAALTTASPARADHAEELAAQTLYDKALELMKAGKAASACPLLTESQRLDPASGTQYRLAECFEKTGRTEAAWRLYTEVAEASKKAGRKERETQAREHAEAVWKLLPRLTILVPREFAKMDGFAIKRDGVTVPPGEWNVEVLVEPGEHIVTAQATGRKAWRGTMTAHSGATEQVWVPSLEVVPMIEPLAPKAVLPVAPITVEVRHGGPNTSIMIAGGALTALSLGIGLAFISESSRKANERDQAITAIPLSDKNLCFPGSHWCPQAVSDADAAHVAFSRVSSAGFIVAGALGAATLTYALLPRAPDKNERPKATIVAGLGLAAVNLTGAW